MVDPDGRQAPMAEGEPRDSMQRVRVGLTGLAVVLVLLAVATAIFRTVDSQMPANRSVAAVNASETDDEPLADLGMAPGAPDKNASAVGSGQSK